ncbi:MAG TPA: Rid family detoxifying hydrolase [Solirubrobacteraceae bacterium]|nr:Rid family detoxifying hydrolase [Solirubrobacteraceae bacterium]
MSDTREPVTAPGAPEAIGPYVHAIRAGDLLFCSGQIPLDPRTGELTGTTAADQAGRCLENLAAVCAAAGTSLGAAVKVTIYLTDMGDFQAVNEVYGSFFESSSPPARVAVAVAALPKGARVEMDAIVAL